MLSHSRPQPTTHTFETARNTRTLEYLDELPPPFGFEDPAALAASGLLNNQQTTMQSDSWGFAQLNPSRPGRVHHQRESSLSSVGSTAGPASPFNPNSSNPQIAFPESSNDLLPDMQSHDASMSHNNFYPMGKTLGYSGYQNFDQMPNMAYPIAIPGPADKNAKQDGGLLPAPDFNGNASQRSNPASGASSNAGDSPATPPAGNEQEVDRRRTGYTNNVPKLDRSMTDIFSDELYNPNLFPSSTPPTQPAMSSVHNDMFNQRINAANNQHLTTGQSPASSISRDRSPFRTGSPFHQTPNVPANNNMTFNSAQRVREQAKAQREASYLKQQMTSRTEPQTPPKTISPKDAMLEFNDADEPTFPLFPQDNAANYEMEQMAKSMMPHGMSGISGSQMMAPPHPTGAQLGYMPSQMSTSLQIPQQYPFISRNQHHDPTARLGSTPSSSNSAMNSPGSMGRPVSTTADGGTYTCTYHGCSLRFDTPQLLQKHKREGHRQVQGLTGAPRLHDLGMGMNMSMNMGMTSSLLNSQAGPHRCDRINPSTGKPCGTVFSRPYDLTRHEDTIHNARKLKVRCDICTEEKTFSRADALTRHYRVCHPQAEVPGKQRRRPRV